MNSNPPAITSMSALDMIPIAQICHNISAITEIDLMTSWKNKPANTNLPACINVHTVMHTLVVAFVTLVVNTPSLFKSLTCTDLTPLTKWTSTVVCIAHQNACTPMVCQHTQQLLVCIAHQHVGVLAYRCV